MASVYTRSGRYYVRYRDDMGQWRAQVSAAKTKTEAKRIAGELERKAERRRLGLEARPGDAPDMTLGELCTWWLDNWCISSMKSRETSRIGKHVVRTEIGKLKLRFLSAAAFEERLKEMQIAGLGAAYINGLRRVLHTVFARALQTGRWIGSNPVDNVERLRECPRTYVTLTDDEVPRLLAMVPAAWRALFATAIWAGMRKGELFGLRKTDVDIRASHYRRIAFV